ncbi:hypothetical protein GCM10020221_04720 [Streptomyces thioluteus]|uniref:Transposase n=1 Tax=Streptomyces thioluteus TaxID=66431 RepID=A0ABN3WGI5_STRTU
MAYVVAFPECATLLEGLLGIAWRRLQAGDDIRGLARAGPEQLYPPQKTRPSTQWGTLAVRRNRNSGFSRTVTKGTGMEKKQKRRSIARDITAKESSRERIEAKPCEPG